MNRFGCRSRAKTGQVGKVGTLSQRTPMGTVREDYSDNGNAWDYFSHDTPFRAYHWSEDGLAESPTINSVCVSHSHSGTGMIQSLRNVFRATNRRQSW